MQELYNRVVAISPIRRIFGLTFLSIFAPNDVVSSLILSAQSVIVFNQIRNYYSVRSSKDRR